ncbi:hypothetical protein DEIPH_ctg004orf0031 [Deinococcus phoenicis]|uniref:Sodium:proton antiporter n=1 Tax=Deinococcus phoenicis TaxID=1476583 RepID=A0A016QUJ7_9DEIO|nr:DUF6328 family protein [Deinococcus phoenicis]EYB69527.1 hypothetical protein DEIPH_ctg004orf0031 [Deinococcus phoenicis]
MAETPDTDRLPSLLGELRILLQGAQVLTSFLIILPFNASFGTLATSERWVYAATFLCSLVSLILLSAPALHHYLRRPLRHPEQFKGVTTTLVRLGAVFISLALVLATRLVAAQVLPGPFGWLAPGVIALLLLGVWWALPLRHERRTYGGRKS